MKRGITIICVIFCNLLSIKVSAKEVIDSVKVLRNCESCKARIEKAAQQAGASKANWSDKTQMLMVSYDDANTTLLSIEKQIAAVGHDTRDIKATAQAYDKLHSCCQYERTGIATAKACDKDEKEKQ